MRCSREIMLDLSGDGVGLDLINRITVDKSRYHK